MNSKIKGWMPPHVVTDFMDHKKQKHLWWLWLYLWELCITTQQIWTLNWKYVG